MAPNQDPPLGWVCDAAQDLEKRALADSVAPNDPQHLAALDLEADIFQGPELFHLITKDDLSAADTISRIAYKIADVVADHIAQRSMMLVALVTPLVSHQVAFGQILDDDGGVGHGMNQP